VIARTHDLAAITGLLVVVIVMSPLPPMSLATIIAALIANQFGGIAPDIDQPTAPFWRNLPIGGLFGRFFGKMLGGHRFLTHSILGVVLMGWLAHLLLLFIRPLFPNIDSDIVWWAFIIGMVSHLIMDSFTKEGVPWLLPIPIKFGFPPLRKLRITTGKKIEKFIVFPVMVFVVVVLCSAYYPTLIELFEKRMIS
jgi:inner membrane protein